jgi:hypothetical protein
MRISIFLIAASLLWSCTAHSEEQTVRVTVFTFKDGRSVEALRYVAADAGSGRKYRITTLAGEKLTFSDDEITSTLDKRVSISSLPEELRPVSYKPDDKPAPLPAAHRIEEPVEITVFTLRDGRTVEAVDVNEQEGQFARYSIILTNGRTVQFTEADIGSRQVKQLDFSELPKQMQEELGAARELRRRSILKAAQYVNDKTPELQRATKRLTDTEGERKPYIDAMIDTEIPFVEMRIAYEDARYDALKTELSNEAIVWNHTTNISKIILTLDQAAQQKSILVHRKKVMNDQVAEYKQLISKLTADVDAAQKDVDAARNALARAKATKPQIYAFNGDNAAAAAPAATPASAPVTVPARKSNVEDLLFGARKTPPKDE